MDTVPKVLGQLMYTLIFSPPNLSVFSLSKMDKLFTLWGELIIFKTYIIHSLYPKCLKTG